MADEIYFFSESYTHKVDAVATSVGGSDVAGHPPADAIDYDKESYWENNAATPEFKIDTGVGAGAIDSLWFKHDNVELYTLYYSTDDITYVSIADGTAGGGGGVKWLFVFTEQTARYWKIIVTAKIGAGNVKIHEVLLMKHRLTLADPDLPSMVDVIPEDKVGGGYQMADGSYSSYAGQRVLVDIAIEFQYTPTTNRDNLYNLYAYDVDGNFSLRSPLVIFPNDVYPEGIYRVLWKDTKFPLTYQISYKVSGFRGVLNFQEY